VVHEPHRGRRERVLKDEQETGEHGGRLVGMVAGISLATLCAMVLALPALYLLAVALYEAITTGTVQVNRASRGAPRAWVPWPQAFAHLLGLALIVASGLPLLWAWVIRKVRQPSAHVLALCFIGAPLGLGLWLFSGTLVTLSGALFLIGFFAFFALMVWIDKHLGRAVTTLVLAGTVGVALFVAARSH
jgi:hypothetical protein